MIPRTKITLLCLCLGSIPTIPPVEAADAAPPAPVTAPAATPPASANSPAGRQLRHLIITESVETAQALTVPSGSAFVVISPALAKFDMADLAKRLAAGENRPIDDPLLAAVAQVIENFFKQNEFPSASVIVPTQSIAEGTVRIVVLLGVQAKSAPVTGSTELKIRNINMQGTRWFSESLLRQKLRIEKGESIRISELEQAIGWTNNNPFRRVQVKLDTVGNTGEADLTIAVQEAIPLRFVSTYDNGGNDAIGKNRFVASASYANLWGKDHTISYQLITSDRPEVFKAHGLDYRVPLSWRHYVQFSASYLRARPSFYQGLFVQDGETVTADLRYTVPLRTGDNSLEAFAAINFKESNNNLAFGGTSVQATKTDIFQLTTGISAVRRDKRGAWAFGLNLIVSPGRINSRNTDLAFDASRYGGQDSARIGAKAAYVYGNLSVQRLLNLAPGWDVTVRAIAQASQANLLSSEQLNIGGASTVRGFNENVFSGDNGFSFSSELLIPAWKKHLPVVSKTRGPLELRPLGFFDAGDTSVRHKFATDGTRVALASAGVGIRASLAQNFSFTADYGWQLTYLPYSNPERSRAHLKATLAF